jgi:hypothetical protein
MNRPTSAEQIAAGKAILDYQKANECLQYEAGAALGYTPKRTTVYVKKYKASRITTAFVDRLESAVNHYKNGNPFDVCCRKFHVIAPTLKQALRQQPKQVQHFQHR